ncbi:MAG TPA: 23S rRNA (guanosine(2251)-2'-O)-methyltransferase RlmB [Firmicutes bacterium]|nr:23S rRNA (guanosine(2251)-2'-O)-methyltransferase RlmB [Bacillota bacterium]
MTNRRDDLVIGRQPVLETLKQGRPLKILLAGNQKGSIISSILQLARKKQVPVLRVSKQEFEQTIGFLSGHQGIAALVKPFSYLSLEELLSDSGSFKGLPWLLLLDHIQDPHNLGAIIRTAHFAGVDAAVIPKRRSVQVTTAVRKVAAGAAERLPVIQVNNLVQTIQRLKKEGFWVYGAEVDGDLPYYRADYGVPLALVLGSEGQGLSPLVRRHCDQILYIPMPEPDGSLNVSVAAAVLIFAACSKRQGWFS